MPGWPILVWRLQAVPDEGAPGVLVGAVLLGIAVLLLAALVTVLWLHQRDMQTLRIALDDSTRGAVTVTEQVLTRGFVASVEPAPEPFVAFTLRYAANPWSRRVGSALVIRARLQQPPRSELAWRRGRTPGVALSRRGDAGLWQTHRLDIVGAEYATRGANAGGVAHHFLDLQRRFGPILYQVQLITSQDDHLVVELRPATLTPEQMPALVGILRALGRVAIV